MPTYSIFFDQTGSVIFSKDGQLSEKEISQAVKIIWNTIGGKDNVAQ